MYPNCWNRFHSFQIILICKNEGCLTMKIIVTIKTTSHNDTWAWWKKKCWVLYLISCSPIIQFHLVLPRQPWMDRQHPIILTGGIGPMKTWYHSALLSTCWYAKPGCKWQSQDGSSPNLMCSSFNSVQNISYLCWWILKTQNRFDLDRYSFKISSGMKVAWNW